MGSLRQKPLMVPQDGAIVMSEANSGLPLKGDFERMARRRFQRGFLELSGDRWIGRWREDVIENGQVKRVLGWHPIGTTKDYPTRRLALRAMEDRLTTINNVSYRPRPVAKFSEFAEKWQKLVLPNLKPSSQPPIKSQLRKHLLPALGAVTMKDFTGELVQSFIAGCKLNPKTVKNLVGTLRMMWNSAKTWDYVAHDPFAGIVLPEWSAPEQPVFSKEDVQRIIAMVDEHYRPALWLLVQTGIRRGELCALNIGDVDFERSFVEVRRSRSGKYITNTKSKRPRLFPISPNLAGKLRELSGGRGKDEPLFLTKEGKRLHPDNFSARVIRPIIRALGLKGGLHAFRHGNATACAFWNYFALAGFRGVWRGFAGFGDFWRVLLHPNSAKLDLIVRN
jgi:integrase